MRPSRVVALVVGCLLVLPGLALLFGATALGVGYAVARDDDGFFTATLDEVATASAVITAEDIDFSTDPGTPDEVFDWLGIELRQRVTSLDSDQPVFVGIAEQADLDRYLDGVAHDVVDSADGDDITYRHEAGTLAIAAPTSQEFWDAAAWGAGTQELVWEPHDGNWAVVLMNADGSPGVAADVEVGAKADIALPVIVALAALGGFVAVLGVVLVAIGVAGERRMVVPATPSDVMTRGVHPVRLEADVDPDVSRWQWLVKWLLAIPHVIALAFLWPTFVVISAIAGVAILVTGRYPRGLFDVAVGILRWNWRVSHYASVGGLGTDRYPPFTLRAVDGDPARFDVAYPDHLSRSLVLVKWWLLALPHYVLLGLVMGEVGWTGQDVQVGVSLIGLLTGITGMVLLVTGRHPRSLFDLLVGMNRWFYRVVAYAGLMTDVYPPFRLDQGGREPGPPREPAPPVRPASTMSDGS